MYIQKSQGSAHPCCVLVFTSLLPSLSGLRNYFVLKCLGQAGVGGEGII
jgi:hypothetical protein